ATTGYGMYVVADRDETVVGFCGFIPRGDRLELGWVVRKPYRGLGFATEAADAAFATARDRGVFAAIRPDNAASIRVAEKIGLAAAGETEDEHGPLLLYVNTPISAWEQHAGWWQREFTDGADPEYEEQILPLIDRHLSGARRVLDVGCGEGQVARRVAAFRAAAGVPGPGDGVPRRGRHPPAHGDSRPSRRVTAAAVHEPPVVAVEPAAPTTRRRRPLWRRPLAACALLFVVYLALSFLNDPR